MNINDLKTIIEKEIEGITDEMVIKEYGSIDNWVNKIVNDIKNGNEC